MFLTGITDEAGNELAVQLRAVKALNWHYLESRNIGQKNLATLSEAEFENVAASLAAQKVKINCYSSSIANFRCHPRVKADFERSKAELLAVLPRMQKLGIPMLRAMSFKNPADEAPDSPELEKLIFHQVQELVDICADHGIIYGHENCMNYGGLSYVHTLKLLDHIKGDAFKLIFDTGNPLGRRWQVAIGDENYAVMQSIWEFYWNVKEFIAHIHIKESVPQFLPDGNIYQNFCFPGEGCGDLRPILRHLKSSGYDAGFSIEPHMAINFQDKCHPTPEALAEFQYDNFVTYGKKFEKLLLECGWNLN